MVWGKLDTTTLTGISDNITIGEFIPQTFNEVFGHTLDSGVIQDQLQFGTSGVDTGSNYSGRFSNNGGSDGSQINQDDINITDAVAGSHFFAGVFVNISTQEKLTVGRTIQQNTTGAGNPPQRTEWAGKWANTTSQARFLNDFNRNTGDFQVGSNLSGLGFIPTVPFTGTVGGWIELGRTTLGSPANTIVVSSLPDKRYYQVFVNYDDSIDNHIRFNGDTGNNYSQRRSDNGSESSNGNTNKIALNASAAGTNARFSVGYVSNLSTTEKLVQFNTIVQSTAGAGTTPDRTEAVGKHAQTSNPIDQMTIVNTGGSFPTGAEVVVLGWDPDDIHSSNFWEELANVSGDNTTNISSGTITAKKYLWIQLYLEPNGSSGTTLQFNNDTATNYATRDSRNGAGDSLNTSGTSFNLAPAMPDSLPSFHSYFVINNATNEKLMQGRSVFQNTATAANAPQRVEFSGKWTDTVSQITEIDINGTNPFKVASTLRVWGSD